MEDCLFCFRKPFFHWSEYFIFCFYSPVGLMAMSNSYRELSSWETHPIWILISSVAEPAASLLCRVLRCAKEPDGYMLTPLQDSGIRD